MITVCLINKEIVELSRTKTTATSPQGREVKCYEL